MKFQVKAAQGSGGIVSVVLDANNAEDATRQARTRGLSVIALRPQSLWESRRTRRVAHFPLALFNQELLALLGAGLSLVEAIETLAERQAHGAAHLILDQLTERLRQGWTLSQAMHELPGAFPSLYVSTVKASERSGGLEDALKRYAAYDLQLDIVRKKVVSASIYPLLLIVAGTLVLVFLMGYVIPKFSLVYEDMRGNLPMASQLLLMVGSFLHAHWLAAGISAAVVITVLVRVLTTMSARRWIAGIMWRIPSIGSRMKLYHLARFYRTLGMLLRGGTPIVSALDMASGLLSPALQHDLGRARQAIREGKPISQAMSENGLTTAVARRMLRVGERSGRMDEMMDRIAAFLDEEIARWIDWFTRLFEPLLMAFIGVVIGIIVVLMYLPVFELAGSIG